jgi:hypothetical protein
MVIFFIRKVVILVPPNLYLTDAFATKTVRSEYAEHRRG